MTPTYEWIAARLVAQPADGLWRRRAKRAGRAIHGVLCDVRSGTVTGATAVAGLLALGVAWAIVAAPLLLLLELVLR